MEWNKYDVVLEMTGRFAASLPKTKKEIEAMLVNRMPTKRPENFIPIPELLESVAESVEISDEEGKEKAELKYGFSTFCRDKNGLYYEGRCIRGHLKDCANQVKDILNVNALKAKVSNKVYVMTDKIYLSVDEVDGVEQRFIQVMTPQGPRSTIKFIDYLERPELKFRLNVLDDDVITEAILKVIFEYGSIHGLGQERSQGWGRYQFSITKVK